MMKVILREDVPNLGTIGELVRVRDGYGRNFLIPQGKATLASPRSVRELDHQKRVAEHARVKATAGAQADKAKLEAMTIVLQAKVAVVAGTEQTAETLQKLFGSITARDLAKVFEPAGVKVDHRRVHLAERVHTVGKYGAKVRLDGGVIASVGFWVIPEGVSDVEGEKRRVEAAQAAAKKAEEDRLAAEKAKLAAQAAQKLEPMKMTDDAPAGAEGESDDKPAKGKKKG